LFYVALLRAAEALDRIVATRHARVLRAWSEQIVRLCIMCTKRKWSLTGQALKKCTFYAMFCQKCVLW